MCLGFESPGFLFPCCATVGAHVVMTHHECNIRINSSAILEVNDISFQS